MRRQEVVDIMEGNGATELYPVFGPDGSFRVVDKEGNAVCALQSLQSGFGSGLIAGETGVLSLIHI